MRVHPIVSSTLFLSVLLVAGLLVAQPADACRQHEIGLPASASSDGALARFVEATEGMSLRERHQWIRSRTQEEQAQLRAEVQALPAEERREMTKKLRQAPRTKTLKRMAARQAQTAPAGS